MGNFWHNLHRDRRRAHALRSTRGRSVELASHHAARDLIGDRRGISILVDHPCAPGSHIPALCRACAQEGGIGDLDRSVSGGIGLIVRSLLLPSARLRREHAPRRFLGSDLSWIHRPRILHPTSNPHPPSLPPHHPSPPLPFSHIRSQPP